MIQIFEYSAASIILFVLTMVRLMPLVQNLQKRFAQLASLTLHYLRSLICLVPQRFLTKTFIKVKSLKNWVQRLPLKMFPLSIPIERLKFWLTQT